MLAYDLLLCTLCLNKHNSHLITYMSGNTACVISKLKETTIEHKAGWTATKILERIADGLIQQVVSIDDSKLGFVPGKDTTDAIFVVCDKCRGNAKQ